MDTIDADLLRRVAGVVEREVGGTDTIIHTVSFELNGAHGGVDVTFLGERYTHEHGFGAWEDTEEKRIFGCASIPDGTLYEEAVR